MPSHQLYHLYRQNQLIKLRKPLFPSKLTKLIDQLAYIVGILGPLSAAPQVYKVWMYQHVEGVSLISFTSFTIFDVVLIFYGIAHRNKILVVMYSLWTLMNGSVAVGVLLFR